jgi:branched-chain amino acid transport system permease protein
MNSGVVIQLMVDTVAAAALYALVAQAVSLAFTGTGVVHLAIGQVGAAGGLAAAASLSAGIPLGAAILLGLAAGAALSTVAERALVAPARGRPLLAAVLLVAAAVVIQEALAGLFPHAAYAFPSVAGLYRVSGGIVHLADLVTIAVVIGVGIALVSTLASTQIGARLRVTAGAPELAERLGVNTAAVRTTTFAAAGALATAAVLLGAARFPIGAGGAAVLALRGLGAAAAGGMSSRTRLVSAAVVIAGVEVVGDFYLGGGGEFLCDAVTVGLVALGWRR